MRRVLSVLVVATAVFTLAACGGGDDDDEATTATTVGTTSATGITPPTYTGSIDSEFCKLGRENNTRLQELTGSFGDPNALGRLLPAPPRGA